MTRTYRIAVVPGDGIGFRRVQRVKDGKTGSKNGQRKSGDARHPLKSDFTHR
jgi:hypothetical protein